MAEQHVKLLQGLGVDQALIDTVEKLTPEEAKGWDPAPVTGSVRTAMSNTLLNDPEFLNAIPEDKVPEATRKKIESGQYTRFQKELIEAATKQLGLEEKDLADLTEEDKKSIKKTMVKIAEKNLAKKGNVQGLQDMQKEVTRLTEQLEAKDADWEQKMNEKLEAVNGSAGARMIKALLKVELTQLQDIELTVPPSYITDPLLAKLQSKYSVVLTDNDELDIKQKDNKALDVLENGKKVTIGQAIEKLVVEDKLGKKKEAETPKDKKEPKRVVINSSEDEDGSVELPSYISDKINKTKELEKD